MSRYSCAQCVLGSFADAKRSAQIWPEQTLRIVDIERDGFTWQADHSMREIAQAAGILPADDHTDHPAAGEQLALAL